ncbi:MAG: hypothetical protein ACTSYI_06545 [Promethearchaeota archaeon]
MPKNLNILKNKLYSYGLSPLEVEILICFSQHELIQANKVSYKLPPANRLKGPRIYYHLKQLSQKGWLQLVGNNPLKYRLSDPNEIRSLLETTISESQQQWEIQKNNYYEVISSFDDLHQDLLGNQKKTVEALILPSQALLWFTSIIHSTHETTPMTYFNGEFNAIIVLNKDNVQFRLNAVEFQWVNGSFPLYAGITICEIDPISENANILEFVHRYNVNGLKFKYKLESKGYAENKARKLAQYQFSDVSQNEKSSSFSTDFNFHINQIKKTGLIQTRQLSAANSNNGLKILTFWIEDPQMNQWIQHFWQN